MSIYNTDIIRPDLNLFNCSFGEFSQLESPSTIYFAEKKVKISPKPLGRVKLATKTIPYRPF